MPTSTPSEVVEQFIAAFERADVDALTALFTEDASYHELPREPLQGRDAIVGWIRGLFRRGQPVAPWERRHLVAQGNLVFSERVDRFLINNRTLSVPVVSVYELRDGKLAAVRDYWDMQQVQRQLAAT